MSSKLVKIALATGGLILVSVFVGVIVFYVWLNRWLASEECRSLVSSLVGQKLKIDGNFQPLQWSGFSVYSEGFEGRGRAGGSLRSIQAEQIRAELNFSALLRGTWEISEITVARVKADLGETEVSDGAAPLTAERASLGPSSVLVLPFLPRQFVLKVVRIRDVDLTWPGDADLQGSLSKTQIEVVPDKTDWKFSGRGGKFFQPGLPELKVETYEARFKPPQFLFVDFVLRDFGEGSIAGRGQADFELGGKLELEVELKRLDLDPFLTSDWRAKVTGKVSGPIQLKTELGKKDGMQAKGTLKLSDAKVEALPVLNQIALLTQTQAFRSLKLQTAQSDFEWEKERTVLSNIVLESELLLKITGNYQQIRENVDGLLQVGTTPEAIRLIPGAEEKVFVEARDGYIWTPVKVFGSAGNPKEDLTPRLQEAALGTVIEATEKVQEKVEKGVNSILDFLNKKLAP